MQISKYLLAAVIFTGGLSPAFAEPNANQEAADRAKARDELDQKMAALEAQLQQSDQPKVTAGGEQAVPQEKANATTALAKEAPIAPKPDEISTAPVEPKPVAAAPFVVPTMGKPSVAAVAEAPVATKPVKATVASTESQPIVMGATAVPDSTRKTIASKPAVVNKPVIASKPPVVNKPAVVSKPVVVVESDPIERAREEMRQKIAELDAQNQMASRPKAKPANAAKPVNTAKAIKGKSKPAPADSAAILRAREEMRQKMAELDAQDQMTSPPATMAPSPITKVERKPSARPITTASADDAGRAELSRKMAEIEAQNQKFRQPATTVPSPITVIKSEPTPVIRVLTPPQSPADWEAPDDSTDDAASALARAELRRKMAELDAQDQMSRRTKPVAPSMIAKVERKPALAATTAMTTKPSASRNTFTPVNDSFLPDKQAPAAQQEAEAQAWKTAGKKSSTEAQPTAMSLIQAPPPAVSVAKQSRLDELLLRYKADTITPEQYHAERARILSE